MILEESGLVGIRECTRCGLTINWLSIREKMETLRRHDWIIDDFGRSDVAVRCLRCGASGHAYMDAGWIDMYPCG
jgi:hypothetical protein